MQQLHFRFRATAQRRFAFRALFTAAVLVLVGALALPQSVVNAAISPTILGTAQSFLVLGGTTVTNTGATVITGGNVGVSPGSAVTGFPPGVVVPPGTIQKATAVAAQAQSGLTSAYNTMAGLARTATLTGQDLGGKTLTSGVYFFATSAQLTGQLTLDARGDPSASFVFQIGSTLITASGSSIALINGASACNVYFQVGSSATLGTATRLVGNILALTSITLTTGASVTGRALARNGAVTLDTNSFVASGCPAAAPPAATAIPATAAPPPTEIPPTGIPPTDTPVPPTDTPVPPTDTPVPTASEVAASPAPPTSAPASPAPATEVAATPITSTTAAAPVPITGAPQVPGTPAAVAATPVPTTRLAVIPPTPTRLPATPKLNTPRPAVPTPSIQSPGDAKYRR